MGLFDFPAPIFGIIDRLLALALPPLLRLVIWGIFAGWLSMVVYRRYSDQKNIAGLKAQQKTQQKHIAEFDGEFTELMPLIRQTLALGFRQLRLALGPALLASVPVLFIVIWVDGEFGHEIPATGSEVFLSVEPANSDIQWSPTTQVRVAEGGWIIDWPAQDQPLTIKDGHLSLLILPLEHNIPIIHKKRWWNLLMANPLGYLPKDGKMDVIHINLPEAVFIATGPGWIHGWMFSFFMSVLLSSIGFKLLFRIH